MIRASLLLSVVLASAPSCPDLYSAGTHGFDVPTVQVSGTNALPDPGGVAVTVDFTAHNPNAFPISVSGIDYQVALQGSPVLDGAQTAFDVPARGDATPQLKGVISRTLPAYRSLVAGQTASYTISGTVHVDSPAGVPVDVDFAQNGSFLVPPGIPQ
ncbi:MAG: LEA type 2 family protein [Deltaproteobacteria bacterium]